MGSGINRCCPSPQIPGTPGPVSTVRAWPPWQSSSGSVSKADLGDLGGLHLGHFLDKRYALHGNLPFFSVLLRIEADKLSVG